MLTWNVLPIIIFGCVIVLGIIFGSITWGILAQRRAPTKLDALDWWENAVIYQINPRSFKDSDGDGIGDLKGIIMSLEHFVDAGVTAIWMSPIFVSPMVDFGYDISDFYNIHEEYGTMADFEELVNKTHKLGLRIILDYVPNHASKKSHYFRRSQAREPGYENYFVWADPIIVNGSRNVPSNWISLFGGTAWEWDDVRHQYYLHQFAKEQVDFNFREPAVRQEMLNIMQYWFEKGVDGLRLDALPHLFESDPKDYGGVYPDEPLGKTVFLTLSQPRNTTQEHTKDLIELYDVVYEWRDFTEKWIQDHNADTKLLLAEAYANITMTMLYYGDDQGRLGAHFPFNFDFITTLSSQSNARDFVYVIKRWLTYMPQGRVANWVIGNHDRRRMASRFGINMVDGLNALNMMLPGVAITYQGDEIGMRDGYVSWEDTMDVQAISMGNEESYLNYSRDPARTPFQWDDSANAGFTAGPKPWLPIAADYQEINLKKQKEARRSHYKVYQTLTSLRQEPALSHGSYFIKALSKHTLILVRYLITHETYALIFNVGTRKDIVDISNVPFLGAPLRVHVSSIHSSHINGDSIHMGELSLQPGEALVLRASAV